MNIELDKKRNDLLYRTNVLAKITAVKTPSRKELIKKVSAMLGVNHELVVVDKIVQNYGQKSSTAYLKVYDDKKHLDDIELNYKVKRTGEIEDKKEESKEESKEKESKEKEDSKK